MSEPLQRNTETPSTYTRIPIMIPLHEDEDDVHISIFRPDGGPINCPVLFHDELLSGTTQFMRLAEQLGDQGFDPRYTADSRKLRRNLLSEEIGEYFDGEDRGNLVEVVDGLLDVIVVAWGTLLRYVGEDKANAAAAEVVRSNLSKVDGSLGPIQRREDGKITKPEGWTPPDIAGAIA